jgi:hypothetical protein
MTEQEWLACRDPRPMLAFVERNASPRKLRLFNCGCCRHVWDHLLTDSARDAVEVTERLADGLAESYELNQLWPRSDEERWERAKERITLLLTGGVYPRSLSQEVSWETSGLGVRKKERSFQAALLRCVFDNPFCPVALSPGWRTPDTLTLAQAAYDNRELPAGTLEPARLNVLADALEEAGCTERSLLDHLRSSGPHVRGCWPIDLLTSRE